MQYHNIRNIDTLVCRLFGHKLNNNPSNNWCGRCSLSYEEIYHPKNYYVESGIVKPVISWSFKRWIEKKEFIALLDGEDDYGNSYEASCFYMDEDNLVNIHDIERKLP